MKKIKRALKVIATSLIAVLACSNFSAYAISVPSSDSIFIESNSVPKEATDYARDMFSHLYIDDIECLGFTYSVSSEMKLAPGFYANAMNSDVKTDNVYYYPVVYNADIVALFTVTYQNGIYSYQFGKDDMAKALNSINTSYTNAVEIIVSNDAFYGITDNEIVVLSTRPEAIETDVNSEKKYLSTLNESDLFAIETSPNVVTISSSTTYSDTAQTASMTRSYIGKKRIVPIVDNWTYTDSAGTLHGTCWASCTGSIIDYYNNGTSSSNSGGASMRDAVLSDRYNDASVYSGGISTAKTYIENYVSGASMTKAGSSLSWSQVKSAILSNNAPCYTRWVNSSSATGHAMVLCGYRYLDTDPTNSSYYGIYLMDPNKTSLQLISYGSTYTINSNTYSWTDTLTKY